jgi:glycine cleavage system H protein
MKVGEYEIAEGLYYTAEHEWLKLEHELVRIGITDYAQKNLHEIVFVDLPKPQTKVNQAQSLGTVESVKAVSDVFSPVSGTVLSVNEKLLNAPELLNRDPYGDGWIALLKPDRLTEELPKLMNTQQYAEFLTKLAEKG